MYEDVKTFPTWRHHATLEPRIFNTLEELEAAGPGWLDSPDRFFDNDDPVPECDENESPPDEVAPEVPPPGPVEQVTIEELRAEARSLGIKGNVNAWKYDTLVRKIEQAKEKKAKGEE